LLIVGLMTGTSLDGIDAALVDIEGDSVETLRWKLIRSITLEFTPERRDAIHDAIVAGSAQALCALNADLGEWLAEAVIEVCTTADLPLSALDLVGSHGQTIWHIPPANGRRGATLQIGCAATIAERTGAHVVSDFRSRDMAANGHGAPLVPWVDHALFSAEGRTRALQNLGGIGNVTLVPPRGSGRPATAFDTGPGNALIDAAVRISTAGRLTYDRDGQLAAKGGVDEGVLADLLSHPFFEEAPPRSTGREMFGQPFVERLVEAMQPEGDQDWLDLIATLTELTARSVADSYRRWLGEEGIDEVIVTGGGAMNPTLMKRIRALLAPIPVLEPEALGIAATEKEALAFAVLAWAYTQGIPANVPTATGAAGPRVLGSWTPGRAAKEVQR
jgi:anhydro-N-acetylmuramic acid kinase